MNEAQQLARIAELELYILSWAHEIHDDQHAVEMDFRECPQELCEKARYILRVPAREPAPTIERMSDADFELLYLDVTVHHNARRIIEYRQQLKIRADALVGNSQTHGKDEREGKL